MEILNVISWKYEQYSCFYTILEIFTSQGILFDNDSVFSSFGEIYVPIDKKSLSLVEKYTEFFALLCLQDEKFINFNPYLVACAVISAARNQCGISPVWPTELQQLAGLSYIHFNFIEEIVINTFKGTFSPSKTIGNSP